MRLLRSSRRYLAALALAGSLIITGCDGGGGSSDGDEDLDPPSGLTATVDPDDYNIVNLTWTSPPDAYDGFELSGRIENGRWDTLPDLAPPDAIDETVLIDSAVPEEVHLTFRLRVAKGSKRSPWSNEATVLRGVYPASNVRVNSIPAVQLNVSWTKNTTLADAIRLERRTVSYSGVPLSDWEARPGVDLADTSFDESDFSSWLDGASLAYRVIYSRGGVESPSPETLSNFSRPLPPADAVAETIAGGVRLTWTNQSQSADHVAIGRFSYLTGGFDLGLFEVPTSTLIDPGVAPGLYSYWLTALIGTNTSIANYKSDSVSTEALVMPAGSSLSGEIVRLPAGDRAARAPDGGFAIARSRPDSTNLKIEVIPPGGTPRYDSLDDVVPNQYELLMDGAGRPHVVLVVQPPPPTLTPTTLRHAWLDGTWQEEVAVQLVPGVGAGGVPFSAAVDAAGSIHVLWTLWPSGSAELTYSTNATGTWTSELVSTASTGVLFGDHLALDPAGTPSFIGGTYPDDKWLMHREAGGWVAEAIPDGTLPPDGIASFFSPGPGRALVFYEQWRGSEADSVLILIERTAAGWQAPVEVADLPFTVSHAEAMSADGTRVAVATNGQPGWLRIRDGDTWGAPMELAPSGFEVETGFSTNGKAWVLTGLVDCTPCFEDRAYVLSSEP